jgi:hypothetical protein
MPEATPVGITKVTLFDVNGVPVAGSGGGGPASIADGADVAQGTTTDAAWVSGAGTVIALLKKIASAGGSAVSVADGADVTQGALADAKVVGDTAGSVSAKLRGINTALAGTLTVGTHAVTGPLTDTQLRASAIPVSAASLPLPTGAALDATIVTTNTEIGIVTEAAPGTDTASSGLNGRLQRIAQRLTTLIGLLPASLGQKVMASSMAVTVASDQTAIPVSGTLTTSPPANASTNVTQFGGSSVSTGTGVGGAGVPRVTVSSDSFPATQAISAASLPLPTGAATDRATAAAPAASRLSDGASFYNALSDTQLRATPVPVSGTVTSVSSVAPDPTRGVLSYNSELLRILEELLVENRAQTLLLSMIASGRSENVTQADLAPTLSIVR